MPGQNDKTFCRRLYFARIATACLSFIMQLYDKIDFDNISRFCFWLIYYQLQITSIKEMNTTYYIIYEYLLTVLYIMNNYLYNKHIHVHDTVIFLNASTLYNNINRLNLKNSHYAFLHLKLISRIIIPLLLVQIKDGKS